MPRLREVSPSFSFTRVHSKQGKVRTCAQTGNHLHRGTVPFQPRIVTPTPDRVEQLVSAENKICNGYNQAKEFLHILYIMASCVELIPNARLYMRPIQLHLLAFWRPSSQDLEVSIPVTQHLKYHLQGWLNPLNTMKGNPSIGV